MRENPIMIYIVLVYTLLFSLPILVRADEDMPELIALELKDTSLIVPNSPQHSFVPTERLDDEVLYFDSIMSNEKPPMKYIIWHNIGNCDSVKIKNKKSKYLGRQAVNIRIQCWDSETKGCKTVYISPKDTFKSPNGNQMEKLSERLFLNPAELNRYLKLKRKNPKVYEGGKHFRGAENWSE
jgi:hypothetical protein